MSTNLYNLDDVDTFSTSRLIRVYLMTAYAYERLDVSLISDDTFDRICRLLSQFSEDEIAAADPHGALINYELLAAGSGFDLGFDSFPQIIVNAAKQAKEQA
jgi:hypothetical protein